MSSTYELTQDVTWDDHFCGGGGATNGIKAAGGRILDAFNHWKPAVTAYNRNNPETRVHLGDLSSLDPSRFVSTTCAWFSPECTTHSIAGKGKTGGRHRSLLDGTPDGKVERSRVTMEDVIRFTAHHLYEIVIVENVVEIARWDDTPEGGMSYFTWLQEMVKLGYDFEVVSLNSMVCWPTPQSRDRWYCVFWRQGNPKPDLDIRPSCWCHTCEATVDGYQWWKRPSDDPSRCGKYGPRQQYLYRCSRCDEIVLPWVWPALSALDLSLPTIRIGDRVGLGMNPLAPATMRRIEVGLQTFGPAAMVQAAGNCFERPGYYRTWPAWQPLKTLTGTSQFGLAVKITRTGGNPRHDGNRVAPLERPFGSQTGQLEVGVVLPLRSGNQARSAAEPMGAVAGHGSHGLVELPWLIDSGGGDGPPAPVHGPGRATTANGSHFLVTLRNHGEARPVDEPMGTLTGGGDRGGMNHAVMVRMNGGMDDAPAMGRPSAEPMGTLTGKETQAVVPFLTHYYGTSTRGSSTTEPMPTLTSIDRLNLVEPDVDPMDCGFRMVAPTESKRGMGFDDDYDLSGFSNRIQVALAGHAVTPPAATELSGRCMASLAPA
jgi:DNA (cytosine-5)-methyltransferase 1